MRVCHRSVASFVVVAVGMLLASCGGGGGGNAPEVNRSPAAADDVLRIDADALDSIDVLGNDDDPDNDALTLAIEEAPPIGTAAVNSNNTVQLTDLPSEFKGVTRFRYRITDAEGASATAATAVFVGTDPFRIAFAADAEGDGSSEVYLADLTADARAVTAATEGNLRLKGFVISEDASTIVYRRADINVAATTDLSLVRTANGGQQVRIAFPDGAKPLQDSDGKDQYVVSDNGQWIAAVAGSNGTDALYLVNVANPMTVTRVSPEGTVHASQPRFTPDSASLYFLATSSPGGTSRILYTVTPTNPAAPVQVSASVTLGSDDILAYTVSADQTRALLQANRGGRVGLYFVDTTQLQTETRMSQALVSDEAILDSTVGLPSDRGGSARGDRVAYTARSLVSLFPPQYAFTVYHADAAATPNPRMVGPGGARSIGFRPDDEALLYSQGPQIYETLLDGSGTELVGAGARGWYDSTGNIVVLQQFLPSGGSPSTYTALAATVRGSFGTTQQLGTPVLASHYFSTSGVSHGVVIIGEGPTTGASPTRARLALVNAMAPDKLIYLADFESPLDLTTDVAVVVSQ